MYRSFHHFFVQGTGASNFHYCILYRWSLQHLLGVLSTGSNLVMFLSFSECQAIVEKGGRFLEAPVSGSKKPAEDGTLIILAAGDEVMLKGCVAFVKSCIC